MLWVPLLMAAVSIAGLSAPGLYRDNLLVASGWRGNDLITLVLAVPVLGASTVMARHGRARAELIRLGALLYVVYNFAFYLFGAAFNELFLAYVALVVFGAAGLIVGLGRLDSTRVGLPGPATRRGVALYLALIGLVLGGVHVSFAVSFIASGELPAIVVATGHPTHVVGALDLSLVVVPSFVSAVWLWQGRAWGFVIAVLVNVKGAMYMAALTAATIAAHRAGALEDVTQAYLWTGIGVGCLVAATALLRATMAPAGVAVDW
jgi:hypothetical protein